MAMAATMMNAVILMNFRMFFGPFDRKPAGRL